MHSVFRLQLSAQEQQIAKGGLRAPRLDRLLSKAGQENRWYKSKNRKGRMIQTNWRRWWISRRKRTYWRICFWQNFRRTNKNDGECWWFVFERLSSPSERCSRIVCAKQGLCLWAESKNYTFQIGRGRFGGAFDYILNDTLQFAVLVSS